MTSVKSVPIEILPFAASHHVEAAGLAAARYREATEPNSLLPDHFTAGKTILPILRNNQNNRTGVVAISGNEMIGFMTGFMFEFGGVKTALIPDWGQASAEYDRKHTLRMLYAALAGRWVGEEYCKHVVIASATDKESLDAWFSLGFGMDGIDAIRDVSLLQEPGIDVEIRPAGPDDLELLMTFNTPLGRHLNQTPVFMYIPPEMTDVSRKQFEDQLRDPGCALFLAYRDGEPVGCMRVIPAAQGDFRLAITNEKTCWITMAFIVAEERNTGIATALLARVLEWARSQGYTRCAVDFESGNIPGAGFWLQHFQPVNYTLLRRIDERIVEYNQGDTPQ